MKNSYEIRGEVTAIFIKSPKHGEMETLIDTNDLDKVKGFMGSWHISHCNRNKTYYIQGHTPFINGKRDCISLHRFLMDFPTGLHVDHVNHNTLDNRRSVNFRLVTQAENSQNRSKPHKNNKSSGVLGVTWNNNNKKWLARIKLNRKSICLGHFLVLEDAALAVKEAREKYFPFSQENLA